MKRIAIAVLVALLGAVSARAQYTSVTAQVLSSNGVPFAGGTGNASFVPSPTATLAPTVGGQPFPTSVVIAQLDSSGNFVSPVSLADNNQVSDGHTGPQASQWNFAFQTQDGKFGFQCKITITGPTQNISAPLQACAPALPTIPGVGQATLAGNNIFTGNNIFAQLLTLNAGLTSVGPNTFSGGGSFAGTFTGTPTMSGLWTFNAGLTSTGPNTLNGGGTLGGNYTTSGTNTHSGTETFTGSTSICQGNTALYVGGSCATFWGGGDIGAQINAAYAALPSTGGFIYVIPQSNGACYSFTTPITFTTSGKYPTLSGLAAVSNTAGNQPGGACLNYTPVTATTAMTLDYVQGVGGGNTPTGGIRDLQLTNTLSYTNGGPGGGSSATGIACGGTNGGAQQAFFSNLTIRGFNVGFSCGNGVSWGMNFLHSTFALNNTGFAATAAIEVVQFFGGEFLANGTPASSVSANLKFHQVHFDSNFSPANYSGSSGAQISYQAPHFENLGVGASSCGANSAEYITSSGPGVSITNGEAVDDCNTGTNTVNWFNTQCISVKGMALTTAGRTPSTAVFQMSGVCGDVSVTLPAAGTALESTLTQNTGSKGMIAVSGNAINAFMDTTEYLSHAGQQTPTCTFTSGGGSGPSCTMDTNSSLSAGVIIATPGTGPSTSGTITLSRAGSQGQNRVGCIYDLSLSGSGAWNARATVMASTSTPGSALLQWDNNSVALTAASTYQINYWCVGR